MAFESESTKEFRRRLKNLSREELLQFIADQNPKYIPQIERIEWVFRNKLSHLNWDNGQPVLERDFTKDELIRLIDPPFIFDPQMARKFGFNEDQQRQIHIASDCVLWIKHFLGMQPKVFQTLMLRDPNVNRVMRLGRRMGKSYTMAFFLLWYSYTHNRGKCIVLAPMKTQVGVIFDVIMEIAEKNELVFKSIARHVASPQYEINFTNGSSIKLFTTGMKSNSKSDVIRGQEAEVIVLDEMDYMGKEDLVAVLPMLRRTNEDQDEKILLAASTPSGQRNMFWEWNHDPAYSKYWYPAYADILWDQKEEDRLRNTTTQIAFRHEYEADWGEDAAGVYPRRLVDIAFAENDWKYVPDIDLHPHSFYTMGIDWDKYGAGVNIVVLQYCTEKYHDPKFANRMRVIYREEMSKDEFLLHKAVQRVIDLNEIFHPRHIYADRGYGEMQMEHIHLYGKEHPETKLQYVAKAWAFNESVEVADPFTFEKVKKELKPFMIDNLRYLLEQEKILFPSEDEELYLQLISYIVVSQTIYDKPRFGPGGSAVDHAHDALLLAAFAIAYNYDNLLNPDFAVRARSVSNEAFLPMFQVNGEKEEEMVKEIWGDRSSAPVYARRAMTYGSRRSSGRPIKRKMF